MDLVHHLVDHTYAVIGSVGPVVFKLTKHTIVMWIAAVLSVLSAGYVGWNYRTQVLSVPRGFLMNTVESFVIYVRDNMVYPIMGEEHGQRYLPFILSLFWFLLVCNFLGLIPTIKIPGTEFVLYPAAAATGDPWINFALAIAVFVVGMIDGIYQFGPVGYVANYVPHGVPWYIWPILLPIEIVGTFIKHSVLAIRLLANMVAGHAVLFGIIGTAAIFVNNLPSATAGWGMSVVPLLLGLLIYALEVLIAVIQAYVFTILSVIFLDMQVSGH